MKLEPEKQFRANDDAIKGIIELYGLDFVTYTAATSGIENTTLIVTATTKKIVVRIYRLGKKETQEIDLEIDFMRYLHNGGVKVPLILANIRGTFVTEIEIDGSHWQVIAMEFIAGEHAQSYTLELLIDIANTQAKMHLLSSSYSASTEIASSLETLKEENFLSLIDINLITNHSLTLFLQRAKEYTVTLDPELPKGLCHLDYDKDNIMANNTAVAVLDFDDLAIAPFVVCLGYTLWHVWRYAGKDMMFKYLSEYEKLRSLNTLEKRYLNKVILFRHYVISDLKILNGHTTVQDIDEYINLESDIISSK